MTDHAAKCARLLAEFRAARGTPLGLAKRHSNLFRRRRGTARRLDVRDCNRVLAVDPQAQLATVEGMTTYDDLVAATLPHGLMPAVVPELKTITVGGALAGIGIEATSFRHGLVHDTLTAVEVLTGRGDLVTCSAAERADLFHGLPNSYGTLGYALQATVRLVPVKPYVRVVRHRHTDVRQFLADLAACCRAGAFDFIDGVIFAPDELYLNLGTFTATAPAVSDYTYRRLYYRSVREKGEDFLTTTGYIWRWDSDWFWCSRHFGMECLPLRLLLGRWLLNSYAYWNLKRCAERCGLSPPRGEETIVQDIGFPLAATAGFLDFLFRQIALYPVWICPFIMKACAPLFPVPPGELHVDVAFWDSKPQHGADGYYNRLIEQETVARHGLKSLYSTSYFDRATFDRLYGGEAYAALKRIYDPTHTLATVYDKCVRRR